MMRLLAFGMMVALLTSAAAQPKSETTPGDAQSDLLWQKLDTRVEKIVSRIDGMMGVAIRDLTDGRVLLRNADRGIPTASSIKLAILLELYRQDQEARAGIQGKAKLNDVYSFDPKDLVEDSQIMAGLTAGATRLTNRDLAQFMVAVSDNAATNILCDRVGKENVNTMLRGLGLSKMTLRRKMMDVAAARRGEENVATPREMVRLLEAIHREQVLNTESSGEVINLQPRWQHGYI